MNAISGTLAAVVLAMALSAICWGGDEKLSPEPGSRNAAKRATGIVINGER